MVTRIIEEGDAFLFPFVDGHQEKAVEEIDFFYLLLVTEGHPWRLILVGKKRLPEVEPGRASAGEHRWGLVRLATRDAGAMGAYIERRSGRPPREGLAASGKYALVEHQDHTELALALNFTAEGVTLAEHLELTAETSAILAVKNPAFGSPHGYPFPREKPSYPAELEAEFDARRLIPARDTRLLDYEQAQVVLVEDKRRPIKAQLGITISEEEESEAAHRLLSEVRDRLMTSPPELPF